MFSRVPLGTASQRPAKGLLGADRSKSPPISRCACRPQVGSQSRWVLSGFPAQ